jgi:hypothetical protein
MLRSLAAAAAIFALLPSAAFACKAHQEEKAKAAEVGGQIQLAQAKDAQVGDSKEASADAAKATGTTGAPAPQTGAKKAKPKAAQVSNPKAETK